MKQSEAETVEEIMSYAYLDNPSHVAIFQGKSETERRIQEEIFKNLFNNNPQETYIAKHKGQILGFIRSQNCTGISASKTPFVKEEFDRFTNTKIERLTLDERRKCRRMVWGKHHPLTLHSHLGPFGVLPDFQGKGIGSELLKGYCARVDRAGLASYLETETEGNVRLYQRFGFETLATDYALKVKNYFMWRDAHSV
jgi:ribosomal protein S18 acetylase RimI-like enzyme